MEVKRLNEKTDHPGHFTAQFANKKVYIGDAAYPLGQLTVDILNLSEQEIIKLTKLTDAFFISVFYKLFNPNIEKTKHLVKDVQDDWNILIDFVLTLPIFKDMRIHKSSYQTILLNYFDAEPELFLEMCHKKTKRHFVVEDTAFSWIRIVNDILTFRAYASSLTLGYLDRLKKPNAESYAVALFDFASDKNLHDTLESAIPAFLPKFQQAQDVRLEYVTMPLPDDPQKYCIAERIEFFSLLSFLHIDLFKGLEAGQAPRQCQNCKQFFLLEKGYHIRYCNRIAPGETKRTCRQVGAHKKENEKSLSPIQGEYKKVYGRLKTRKSRKKISVDEWNKQVAQIQEIKEKVKQGKMDEMKAIELFQKM